VPLDATKFPIEEIDPLAEPEEIVAVMPNQRALPATSPAQAQAEALATQESQRATTAARAHLAADVSRNRLPSATVPTERDSYVVTAFADVLDRSLHAAAARFTAGLSPAALAHAHLAFRIGVLGGLSRTAQVQCNCVRVGP
jgi:Poly-beta-hydroxybutyrate polymerase N terminal